MTHDGTQTKLAEDRADKLPSDRFTVTLPVLMELIQVEDKRDLPEIWGC